MRKENKSSVLCLYSCSYSSIWGIFKKFISVVMYICWTVWPIWLRSILRWINDKVSWKWLLVNVKRQHENLLKIIMIVLLKKIKIVCSQDWEMAWNRVWVRKTRKLQGGPCVLTEPLGMSRILSPDKTSRNLQMVLYRVTLGSVLSRKPLPVAPQQIGVAELEKWYQVRRKYHGYVTYRFKLWSNRAVVEPPPPPPPHTVTQCV